MHNEIKISNLITIIIPILTILVSSLWFIYSLDRRVYLLEAHDVVHDRQISEIKDCQNITFNRVDTLYTMIKNPGNKHGFN